MERVVRSLAWPIAIVTGVLVAGGLILLGLTLDRPYSGLWGFRGFSAIFAIEGAFLGALIMQRRPQNVIGPLLAVVGLCTGLQPFTSEYLVAGADGALPAITWVSWIGAFIWVVPAVLIIGYLPLLFPDGRLLSRRWRSVAWLLGLSALGAVAAIAVQPNVGAGGSTIPYPFTPPFDAGVVNVFWTLAYGLMGVGTVAAIGSLWLRWRRSVGVEREQLKWLAWAGGLVVVAIPVSVLPYTLAQAVFIFAVATVPLAIGIAVLRYRLYDIDTVISRTLVYGALTAILAGLFAGGLRLLQGVFVSVTGNESDAAWAITALILAAIFAPLRNALERVVAGRFKEPSAPDAVEAAAAVPSMIPTEDLEAMLRRVVREEVGAALADRPPTG